MKLETIIKDLEELKKGFSNGVCLKNYCTKQNISYTSTSRILKRGVKSMELRTAYNILGLTPERNISQVVLGLKINELEEFKKAFLCEML